MLRKAIVLMLIISALVLTGCGNGRPAAKTSEASPKTSIQAGNDTIQEQKTKAANEKPSTNDSTALPSGGSNSNQTTGGPEIVAKSENIMSSSDKKELLNQVDKELDSLFNSINNLDDAQDSDLDLSQNKE